MNNMLKWGSSRILFIYSLKNTDSFRIRIFRVKRK